MGGHFLWESLLPVCLVMLFLQIKRNPVYLGKNPLEVTSISQNCSIATQSNAQKLLLELRYVGTKRENYLFETPKLTTSLVCR